MKEASIPFTDLPGEVTMALVVLVFTFPRLSQGGVLLRGQFFTACYISVPDA